METMQGGDSYKMWFLDISGFKVKIIAIKFKTLLSVVYLGVLGLFYLWPCSVQVI
jgi:hypothetical protein